MAFGVVLPDQARFCRIERGFMQERSEELDLYHRVCSGDESALEALIAQYRTGLTLFIYSIVHNREDAEDLMIDTFAELVASCGRFRGQSSLKTYLFGIARHLALHQSRKSREIPMEPEQVVRMQPTPQGAISAEEDWLKRENVSTLYAAIGKLLPDYRQALVLVFLQGMNQREAAQIMKKNQTQFSHLIARGKQALRRLLEEHESHEK